MRERPARSESEWSRSTRTNSPTMRENGWFRSEREMSRSVFSRSTRTLRESKRGRDRRSLRVSRRRRGFELRTRKMNACALKLWKLCSDRYNKCRNKRTRRNGRRYVWKRKRPCVNLRILTISLEGQLIKLLEILISRLQ